MLLIHFLIQQVQAVTDYLLQFYFGGIDKFAQREVLRSHFINTQILHLVDVR